MTHTTCCEYTGHLAKASWMFNNIIKHIYYLYMLIFAQNSNNIHIWMAEDFTHSDDVTFNASTS